MPTQKRNVGDSVTSRFIASVAVRAKHKYILQVMMICASGRRNRKVLWRLL